MDMNFKTFYYGCMLILALVCVVPSLPDAWRTLRHLLEPVRVLFLAIVEAVATCCGFWDEDWQQDEELLDDDEPHRGLMVY